MTSIARLVSSIPVQDIVAGARLLRSLPGFLRNPIGVEQARAILRRRLEHREGDFLALARTAIFGQAASPYRHLLRLAGCEYGDLERLVGGEGLEGALSALLQRGVYLTVDELKGRRPAVRGSTVVAVDPVRLRNPSSAFHVAGESSGSRGPRTRAPFDLALIRDRAVDLSLVLDARGGGRWLHALWEVPGGAAIVHLLDFSAVGTPPIRWFSQVSPTASDLHPCYRWSARGVRWVSLLAGTPLPRPDYVPLRDSLSIARWMAKILGNAGTPHLYTFPSSAVGLCQAAREAGIALRGAQFTLAGEPITAARLATIRAVGAEAVPRYACIEASIVAEGCLAPAAADDLHLLHDVHALVQPGPDVATPGLPAGALVISSLRPTAPLILLNVSLGDQAQLAHRECGCPLERLGWTTHLHTVRSFEKLTAGGMTFLDRDLIRVLEVALPARFGGGPTDYQLQEEETRDGRPRLRLLVHPSVSPLDNDAVADAFLEAIGGGSGVERVMELHWRQAGLLRVERGAPLAGTTGKILHLHQQGRATGRSDPRSAT